MKNKDFEVTPQNAKKIWEEIQEKKEKNKIISVLIVFKEDGGYTRVEPYYLSVIDRALRGEDTGDFATLTTDFSYKQEMVEVRKAFNRILDKKGEVEVLMLSMALEVDGETMTLEPAWAMGPELNEEQFDHLLAKHTEVFAYSMTKELERNEISVLEKSKYKLQVSPKQANSIWKQIKKDRLKGKRVIHVILNLHPKRIDIKIVSYTMPAFNHLIKGTSYEQMAYKALLPSDEATEIKNKLSADKTKEAIVISKIVRNQNLAAPPALIIKSNTSRESLLTSMNYEIKKYYGEDDQDQTKQGFIPSLN